MTHSCFSAWSGLSAITRAYDSRCLEMEFGSIACLNVHNEEAPRAPAAATTVLELGLGVPSTNVHWAISPALVSESVSPFNHPS